MISPEPFSGELDRCRGFLLQCKLIFAQQSQSFMTNQAQIYYVLGLLRERALAWAEALVSNQELTGLTFDSRLDQGFLVYRGLFCGVLDPGSAC